MLLSALRQSVRLVAPPMSRVLSTTSMSLAAPRPKAHLYKLKTHSATKKRFFPIQGSSRGPPKIKRAHSNKQHLNSGMSRTHLSRLRRPQIVATGAVSRMLRRLLAPIV